MRARSFGWGAVLVTTLLVACGGSDGTSPAADGGIPGQDVVTDTVPSGDTGTDAPTTDAPTTDAPATDAPLDSTMDAAAMDGGEMDAPADAPVADATLDLGADAA